jgi:hypothetical protein
MLRLLFLVILAIGADTKSIASVQKSNGLRTYFNLYTTFHAIVKNPSSWNIEVGHVDKPPADATIPGIASKGMLNILTFNFDWY